MKIGMVTDTLGHLSFDKMLATAAGLGIQGLEFNAANWTSAPHFDVQKMVSDAGARKALSGALKSHNLELTALNAKFASRADRIIQISRLFFALCRMKLITIGVECCELKVVTLESTGKCFACACIR